MNIEEYENLDIMDLDIYYYTNKIAVRCRLSKLNRDPNGKKE